MPKSSNKHIWKIVMKRTMITTWIDILVITNAVYSFEPDVVRPGKIEDKSHEQSADSKTP